MRMLGEQLNVSAAASAVTVDGGKAVEKMGQVLAGKPKKTRRPAPDPSRTAKAPAAVKGDYAADVFAAFGKG